MAKKHKGRDLILLLGVMVILGGTYYGIRYYNANKGSEKEKKDSKVQLFTASKEDMQQIDYTFGEEQIHLVKEEEKWKFIEDKNCPVNQTKITSMVNSLSSISTTRVIEENQDNLKEYGLEQPNLKVTLYQTDGSKTTIQLGVKTPIDTGGYYATVDGKNGVYLVDTGFYSSFSYKELDLVEVESLPSITATYITNLEVKKEGAVTFQVDYDETKEDTEEGPWCITKPYDGKVYANPTKLADLFTNYSNLSFVGTVEYDCKDYSLYGLDHPTAEIEIKYYELDTQESTDTSTTAAPDDDSDTSSETEAKQTKIEKELLLYIGDVDKDGNYYVRQEGSTGVYLMGKAKITTMCDINPLDEITTMLNSVGIDHVNQVEFEVQDKVYTLEMRCTTEKSDEGKETETVEYVLNGTKVEEEAAKNLYRIVCGLSLEGQVIKEPTDHSKIVEYTITYEENGIATTKVVAFYRYDDSFYSVATNGGEYFTIDKRAVDQLVKTLEEM